MEAPSLFQKIKNDLTLSLKQKEDSKVETLRLLLSAIHNVEIEKRRGGEPHDLNDREIETLIRKELKKRSDAIDLYTKANRSDLSGKESAEKTILETYLPKVLSSEEIREIVQSILRNANPDEKEGVLMGKVMKQTEGRADATSVREILKEERVPRG